MNPRIIKAKLFHHLHQLRTPQTYYKPPIKQSYRLFQTATTMPVAASQPETVRASNIPKGKKEVKILMLHGFTQSGHLFSSKTKALSKLLVKALAPPPYNMHPTLIFPTAPHRLRPSDIPGYSLSGDGEEYDDADSDTWGWWRNDDATNTYRGFEQGVQTIADAIAEAGGGVDGIVGFSQGAAMTALVTSALELPYRSPPANADKDNADYAWLDALRAANGHKPVKFAVVYSGFWAKPAALQWLYEPVIATPTLHFIGSLDTVVEEGRSQALIDRCRDPTVVTHPGGHYVPVAKDWALVLVGWLRQKLQDEEVGLKKQAM
ncbi:hypothetical protein M426DRAFT_70331 [Hypoxylon sp. CI-4A]|nr:hypothetical protein M426DRAFT_70331 [Hypoxylon sp. CI-4A]